MDLSSGGLRTVDDPTDRGVHAGWDTYEER